MKDLRRIVSTLVIGSFSLAALIGIVTLLRGGDFGDTEIHVLLTTVIVGVESVAVLCYLAVSGHRLAVVGLVGAAASFLASALALWMTWGGNDSSGASDTFGVALTIAASLAQVSLLLSLAGRDRAGAALVGTLLAIAVLAGMIVLPIVDDTGLGDGYWRAFGVVAILDVLGTVVLIAVGVFRKRPSETAADHVLTSAVEQRLLDAARERGTSPSQLVSDALDAFLS